MRVVLLAETIKQPLTGIGRYAWELATRLPFHPDVQSLGCLAHGCWKNQEEITKVGYGQNTGRENAGHIVNGLYRQLRRSKFISEIYDLFSPLLVKARINKKKFDLLHGPNYFVPELDVPSVVTIHDLSTLINPAWHQGSRVARINKILIRSIQNARVIITDSQAIRAEVMKYFSLTSDRVVAVPLGVDASFRPRNFEELRDPINKLGIKPGGYCLCVSTIEPRKNIIRMLSAYRELPVQMRNHWPLVLVGETGWNSDDIHLVIKQAVQEGWLKYLGFVPQDLLPMLYAGCRLFIYPSLYEGFGLPIAEAMASGVPVLTSNRSSMPEVAGGAAWLVNPEDNVAIKEAMLEAIEDEPQRFRIINAGLSRAVELGWDTCIEKTADVYRAVLDQG